MKKISGTVKSIVIATLAIAFQLNIVFGQVATIKNWTNVYHGISQNQQNLTYSVPSGSNANRVLVVAVSSSRWATGSIGVTLTYGGQTLTFANGDMATATVRQHTALYYLNEAGLDAATSSTLSATVSAGGSAIMVNTDIWAAVFDYVNQASPLTDSRTYSSGTTSQVSSFSFGTALTINAFNRAVEVVNSYNPAQAPIRTITYASNWTMVRDSTATLKIGLSGASIRNGVANRSIPNSTTTDLSNTSFSGLALASMTALSLNYEAPPPPTIQTSNVTFSDVTTSSFTINWTSGNGSNRIVLVKSGSAVDSDPVDGTTYTAGALFGSGSQIGTGNFVVYNGTGYNVNVFNLDANTTYHVAVYEFSGPPGMEDYLTPDPARGSQLTEPETAVTDDYRSNGSGAWGTAETWQTFDGTSWVTAGSSPNSSSGLITIRNGHTITVAEAVTVDQVVVEAGAQLTAGAGVTLTVADGTDAVDCSIDGILFNQGAVTTAGTLALNSSSKYEHARNGGTIPTATWDASSLCLVTGITDSAPSGFAQSFGNFTWNCSSQTVTAALNSNVTIKGDFRISGTGTGGLSITDSNNPYAITVSGNFFQTAGILNFNSGASSSAVDSLNVAGNFSFTGGTITETSASTGKGSVVFNGTSMQIYTSGGTLSNTIDFTVTGGAYLQMGTGLNPSYITNSNGTFTLSAGATLGITDRWGITKTTSGNLGGNIKVSNTRSYSQEANYIYNGSVNQYTSYPVDIGLPPTVNSLVFDNPGRTVVFSAVCTITNNFAITAGSKANLGTFTHTTSLLTLGGAGQQAGSYGHSISPAEFKNDIYFDEATGVVNNQPPAGTWLGLTNDWNEATNWVGGVPTSGTNASISSFAANQPVISAATTALSNTLSVNPGALLTVSGTAEITTANNTGTITINPGGQASITTLTSNGTLNLESDASGMFSLMTDNYSGTGTINSTLFLTGGIAGDPANEMYRWHYFAVPSQQNKSVLTNINAENLMWYNEPAAQNDIWEGWQWHDGYDGTTPITDLLVTDGYSFYHDEDAWVTFSGNSLLTSLPPKSLSFTYLGWNFIGNSLTCGINWDNVTFNGNVDPTVHFLKDYQEYYYMKDGPSSPYGSYAGHIPPLQGFFIKAGGSGASLDFSAAREHNDTPYYKGSSGENKKSTFPLIRLILGNDIYSDETVIWFNKNSTMGYDRKSDAEKRDYKGLHPQIYSSYQDKEFAINGIPLPEISASIPLAIRVPEKGNFSIRQIELEGAEGYGFYLKDIVQNTKIRIDNIPEYSFTSSAGTFRDRFVLIIENLTARAENPLNTDKPFNIYTAYDFLNIELLSDVWEGRKGTVKVIDLTGRTIIDSRNIEFTSSSPVQIPLKGKKGLFMIEIASDPLRHTTRVTIR